MEPLCWHAMLSHLQTERGGRNECSYPSSPQEGRDLIGFNVQHRACTDSTGHVIWSNMHCALCLCIYQWLAHWGLAWNLCVVCRGEGINLYYQGNQAFVWSYKVCLCVLFSGHALGEKRHFHWKGIAIHPWPSPLPVLPRAGRGGGLSVSWTSSV